MCYLSRHSGTVKEVQIIQIIQTIQGINDAAMTPMRRNGSIPLGFARKGVPVSNFEIHRGEVSEMC
jgi:hypothetical protein